MKDAFVIILINSLYIVTCLSGTGIKKGFRNKTKAFFSNSILPQKPHEIPHFIEPDVVKHPQGQVTLLIRSPKLLIPSIFTDLNPSAYGTPTILPNVASLAITLSKNAGEEM